MKVLLLIAIILGVFSPLESKLATFKVPTNYEAGDWNKIWDGLSKCITKLPDPFPIPIPIPIDIVQLVETLFGKDKNYITGKFDIKNIKISEFTKAVDNRYAKETLEFDYSLPVSLELDYEATKVKLINVVPLKGQGNITFKLNLRANGKLTYDESGKEIELEFEKLDTTSKPYMNITGLLDDERMSELISRQISGIVDDIFKTLEESIDIIIAYISNILQEQIPGLFPKMDTLEDLIAFLLNMLFNSDTKDIMDLLELCHQL